MEEGGGRKGEEGGEPGVFLIGTRSLFGLSLSLSLALSLSRSLSLFVCLSVCLSPYI